MNDGLADALFFEAGAVVPRAALVPDEAVMAHEDSIGMVEPDLDAHHSAHHGLPADVGADAGAVAGGDFEEGFWWPSDVVQEIWVGAESGLSRSMAAMVTARARERVMHWIAAAGLHPVEVYGRFAQGCFSHGAAADLVPDGVGRLIDKNPDFRWRGLMDAIFGRMAAPARNALENDIYGVLLAASADGRLSGDRRADGVDGDLRRVSWFAVIGEDDVPGEPVHRELADWAAGSLLEFLVDGGLDPFRVVQRFYGLCFLRYKSIIGEMNGRDLAGIMSQGRAQFSAMERRIFTDPVEWVTGERMKVQGQKSAEASAVYAANARKHKPKRMLRGQAGESAVDLDLERALASRGAQKRLADMKAAAEAREVARADAEWQELFKRKDNE